MYIEEYLRLSEPIDSLAVIDESENAALPPNNVDALTDDEDNYLPVGDNILNNEVLPEISRHVELFAINDYVESFRIQQK